ncbi:MAG: FAD-dependent oxidoreductase [Chitinophagaceae bacterium]|nr:FAD-dependent oxidoreductase [Chitinophagaceae bacterium]
MNRRDVIKLLGAAPLVSAALPKPAQSVLHIEENVASLLVFGATPGGVACAVRAARENLQVILVSAYNHLGGMFANGLGIMDTLYNGSRSPIYDEFRKMIYDFYRKKFGSASNQYKNAGAGISKTKYEANVAERLINEILEKEPNIHILKTYYPAAVEKDKNQIKSVLFESNSNGQPVRFYARYFADCSYEGDLLALAGAEYQLGRESREKYGEKYAGVIFSKDIKVSEAPDDIEAEHAATIRQLNLYRYPETRTKLFSPESTGQAHPAIQAFNLRTILTDEPANRVDIRKPAVYNAAHFKKEYIHNDSELTLSRPNRKSSLNYPKLLVFQNKYVEGGWKERKEIMQSYYDELLGLIYFRQNDESLSEETRRHWRKYGLAKDEFADNQHLPYELYVREGRRLVGSKVFTGHDAMLAPGMRRAPVHTDSIAVTEWFLDSHACTSERVGDSKEEGEVMLKSETVPGQVSLATIFSRQHDNLLVPVCLSASHIGWGAIRLEPVWMQTGEVAAYCIAEAISKNIRPKDLNEDAFTRKLASAKFLISFFNDVEGRESAAWYPAVQYLGTKGFFDDYEAEPDAKLTQAMAKRWIEKVKQRREIGKWILPKGTTKLDEDGQNISVAGFCKMLETATGLNGRTKDWLWQLKFTLTSTISRGQAAQLIMEATSS